MAEEPAWDSSIVIIPQWNKNCSKREKDFAVINKFMHNEYKFDFICKTCEKPYAREFVEKNNYLYLAFRCGMKMCPTSLDPFTYNLTKDRWEGNIPNFDTFEVLEDMLRI